MTKTTPNNYSAIEVTKSQIGKLLDQLIVCERNAKEERKRLLPEWQEAEDFTVLDEMEMLTADIRGYASQVNIFGGIKNENEAIQKLEHLQIFERKNVADWYFNTEEGDYLQIKLYLSLLDYLRLLVLKYLQLLPTPKERKQEIKAN
jgi:hypothetical protein